MFMTFIRLPCLLLLFIWWWCYTWIDSHMCNWRKRPTLHKYVSATAGCYFILGWCFFLFKFALSFSLFGWFMLCFWSFSYFLDSCSIRYFIYFARLIILELASSSSSLLLILQVLAHWIICLATFFTKVILLLFVHFSSSLPFRSFNCSALRTIVINMNANSKPFFSSSSLKWTWAWNHKMQKVQTNSSCL